MCGVFYELKALRLTYHELHKGWFSNYNILKAICPVLST